MEELFKKMADIAKKEKISISSVNVEKNGDFFSGNKPCSINLTLKFENKDTLAVVFHDIMMNMKEE